MWGYGVVMGRCGKVMGQLWGGYGAAVGQSRPAAAGRPTRAVGRSLPPELWGNPGSAAAPGNPRGTTAVGQSSVSQCTHSDP